MRPTVVSNLPHDAVLALRGLEALTVQPEQPEHDIVLVDDDAPALVPLLARVEGDVEIVRLPRRSGHAAAYAAGIAAVQTEVVVLLAPGATPAPGFLQPLLDALADPGVFAAAAGPAASPAATAALAFRRADLHAVPDVPDELALAAIALQLGSAQLVAASVVTPAAAVPRARGELGRELELSVVIPTLDASSARVRACVGALTSTLEAAHEIVVLDNGAPPQGYSAPVNAGLRAARGAYMVVLNDDVEVLPGWWPHLRAALDAGAAVAFPRTVDAFDREDFAAWCFALSRETLDRFSARPGEFFDPDMRVWFQDTDLLTRLRQAGRPPVRVEAAAVRHATSTTITTPDPELQAWIATETARDRATFERKYPGVRLVERSIDD